MSCHLTEEGSRSMSACRTLSPLKKVLERTSSEEHPSNMSTFELLSLFLEKGWSWRLPVPKKRPPPYKVGDEKCFYSRARYLLRSYLLALLKADAGADPDQVLHHCQAGPYYEAFLAGTAGNKPPSKRARHVPRRLAGGDGENVDMCNAEVPVIRRSETGDVPMPDAEGLMEAFQGEERLEGYIARMLEDKEANVMEVCSNCVDGERDAQREREANIEPLSDTKCWQDKLQDDCCVDNHVVAGTSLLACTPFRTCIKSMRILQIYEWTVGRWMQDKLQDDCCVDKHVVIGTSLLACTHFRTCIKSMMWTVGRWMAEKWTFDLSSHST